MKKYFVYIKTVLFLCIIALVVGFTAKRNANRSVQKVAISFSNEDNLFLTHKMVDNLLIQNGEHVVNKLKSLINLQELEHKVELHPMVSNAEVSIGISGNIHVGVQQRKPLARMFGAQKVVYLDVEGKEMPLSTNYSARVPVIDNKNGLIEQEEVFPLVQKIHSDLFYKDLIVAIHKNEKGYWLQTRYHQQKVLLGSLEEMNKKFKKMKVFYNYAQNDSLTSTFKTIDLQYNKQVVCSK